MTDAYHSLVLALENRTAGLNLNLECRAYNEGFAFRYVFPKQTVAQIEIVKENTEYVFTGDHAAWPVYSAQGEYKPTTLSTIQDSRAALTIETGEGPVIALGEAGLFTLPA